MTAYEQSMAELVKRLEEAELRIAVLEVDVHQIDSEVSHGNWEPKSEVDRKACWHLTFNAALTGLLAKDACSGCHNDEFIRAATVFADLAHGPLEAKAAAVIPPIEHASWKMFADPRVDALVKAVLEACDYALPDQVMALLTKAVEPFEREQQP